MFNFFRRKKPEPKAVAKIQAAPKQPENAMKYKNMVYCSTGISRSDDYSDDLKSWAGPDCITDDPFTFGSMGECEVISASETSNDFGGGDFGGAGAGSSWDDNSSSYDSSSYDSGSSFDSSSESSSSSFD